jgi:hypothetical protein
MEQLDEKQYHYLVDLYDTPNSRVFHEFIKSSNIWIEQTSVYRSTPKDGQDYKLYLIVAPDVLKKYQDHLDGIKRSLKKIFHTFYQRNIQNIVIKPDLDKFKIIDNSFVALNTPWEDINKDQEHLLALLKTTKEIQDFQNIGNSSRTIMEKVSNIVFDPVKHLPETKETDLSKGKYKNRLRAYIYSELGGSDNKEVRLFAYSIIESCEKSINLSNALTHDLKATSLMAESSVMGVLTTLNIIRLVEKN